MNCRAPKTVFFALIDIKSIIGREGARRQVAETRAWGRANAIYAARSKFAWAAAIGSPIRSAQVELILRRLVISIENNVESFVFRLDEAKLLLERGKREETGGKSKKRRPWKFVVLTRSRGGGGRND